MARSWCPLSLRPRAPRPCTRVFQFSKSRVRRGHWASPFCFRRLSGRRELSVPLAPGSPPTRVSSTRDDGLRCSASFGRASSAHREAEAFHPVGLPVADRDQANLSRKTKRAGTGSRLFRLYLIRL